MTDLRIPPGNIRRLDNGWSIRWHPTRKTTKVALFVEITSDNVLELEHIRTIRTSCRESSASTNTDADPCDVPDAFLAVLRDRGYDPAHVSGCDSSREAAA